jgi:hypothetical protein
MSEENDEMRLDGTRAKVLASNFQSVAERVSKVAKGRNVRDFGLHHT